MNLRPATYEDAELLFDWANDPADRAASIESQMLDFMEHCRWLIDRLPAGGFYIGEQDGVPIGTARVDRRDDLEVGEISFSIDAGYRGKGLGTVLVGKAAYRATQELGLTKVRARAKPGNEASLRTLAAAGFHTEIPHSRPAGGQLVDGPATAELERRWCELTGMRAAAAVGSGTAALRLALLALGVGPGDEVIVPAYSCVALLNAPLSIGAVPVLADVVFGRWTLDPEDVLRRASDRTAAIIAVNLFGVPADIAELPGTIPVIEDCSHGPILGRTEISVASLYATKLIGAGMGGIVAARDVEQIEHVRRRCSYGDQLPDGFNLNDKITEYSAATAVGELGQLAVSLRQRAKLARRYIRALGGEVTKELPIVRCTYCGLPAEGRDHLTPQAFAYSMRSIGIEPAGASVLLPACTECNSTAGSQIFGNMEAKRAYIHAQYQKKYRRILRAPTWTEAEILEAGPGLQSHVRAKVAEKELVAARLAWPRGPLAELDIEDPSEEWLRDDVSVPKTTNGRVWYRFAAKLKRLSAADVAAQMHTAGVHAEQPVWDLRGCRYWRDDLPVASEAFERLISLPLYPGLTEGEQQRVIDVFRDVLA